MSVHFTGHLSSICILAIRIPFIANRCAFIYIHPIIHEFYLVKLLAQYL